jgi:hypothetical protein
MIMHPVVSSELRAVGYDSLSQTLRIEFHNSTHEYYSVPEHVYRNLMSAPSKGRFHDYFIKDVYRYKLV